MMLQIRIYIWMWVLASFAIAAKNNCDVVEEKLHTVLSCDKKLVDDNNYSSVFMSLHKKIKEENMLNTDRKIHVNLDNNAIRMLKRIPDLQHVSKISFRYNRIVNAEPGTFQDLPQLKSLDLGYNELIGDNLTAEIFRGVEMGNVNRFYPLQLEHLSLSHNRLTYLRRDLFNYLPNLKSLELNYNPINIINGETERAVHSLRNLQILKMENIGIAHVPDMLFETIPIATLFLNGNRLARIPKSLSESSTIRYLNLNDNPIEEINSLSLAKLMRLQELEISGMKNLTRITENAFSPLINMEVLRCSFNPNLKFVHPKVFASKNNKLKEMFINDNALEYISEDLLDWKKLYVLDLRGNPWNCTCSLRWLFELIETRQHHDPESNLGIRCQYPEDLSKRSLVFANDYLQCDVTRSKILRKFKAMDFVLWVGIVAGLCIAFQLLYMKVIKNKFNYRHSGTSIKSTVKYRSARSTIYL